MHSGVRSGWYRGWMLLSLLMLLGAARADPIEEQGWYYLEDNQYTPEEVQRNGLPWQKSRWQAPNLGFTFEPHWFRLQIPNGSVSPGNWYLLIEDAILTDVRFWLVEGNAPPREVRPADTRMPLYPVQIQYGQQYEVYLRVESNTALQLPTKLLSEYELVTYKEVQDSALGLFVGILFAMMLYNLVLYISIRDTTFLLYVGHSLALLFFVFSWQGLGNRYLWSSYPGLQNMSIALATFAVIAFSTWFCGVFLNINEKNFKAVKLFWFVRNLGFVGFVITPFMPAEVATYSSSLLSFFAVLMVVSAMVARVSLRHRPSRLFLMGWTMYVIGALVMGLNKFGWIEVTAASENLILWGAVFDMVLLCIALGDKYHEERNLKLRVQEMTIKAVRREKEAKELAIDKQLQAQRALQEAADAQEDYSMLLERRVRERTQELKRTKQDLEHISELDALTKLKNRRFLIERLQQEQQYCMRSGYSFALVMVDIDHFKQVNDSYGHLAGDECIRSVGRLMQEQLRPGSDIVCRYGGEEFVLILPSTGEQEAMQVAERLRAHVAQTPILCDGRRIMVTVSAGVMVVDRATLCNQGDDVIQQADQALYQAKHQGRNCVCLA
ncbi:MAG: diguanylate cyclase [Pseudomonadota bacterium]|nr:diguanylate cyclase [Pseudomonadota bacterium]